MYVPKWLRNPHVPKWLRNPQKHSAQQIWDGIKKVYTDNGMTEYLEPLKQMIIDAGTTGIDWGL